MNSAAFVVDASVALKWFVRRSNEPDVDLAVALIGRHPLQTTSLAIFEIGARLCRGRNASPSRTETALDRVQMICGEPIGLEPADCLNCATLAQRHGITFYDASYVVIAGRLGRRVISADRDLLEPSLAIDMATALEAA